MLETIVAISILSISISGVFSAIQKNFSQSIIARDEVKAFYLAQEAVEIIRNKRDSNQLNKMLNASTNSWLYGIAGDFSYPCDFGKVCRADAASASLVRCGDAWNSCPVLNQDPATFLYGYNSNWTATNFKREIQIEQISADEISITVRIYWTKGIVSKEFKVKTLLLNWI